MREEEEGSTNVIMTSTFFDLPLIQELDESYQFLCLDKPVKHEGAV